MRTFLKQAAWYLYKLPVLLLVILIGFLFEYIVMLPFMAVCLLNGSGPARGYLVRRPRR